MADLEELKQRVKITDYLQSKGHTLKKVGANYRVSPCPICNSDSKKHFTINPAENLYNAFSGCGRSGSIIDLIMQLENKTEAEAIKELYILAGEDYEQQKREYAKGNIPKKTKENQPKNNDITEEQKHNATTFLEKIYTKEGTEEAIKVLANRGITAETIKKYKICIGKDKKGYKRAYIPLIENGEVVNYTGRALDPNNEMKYDNGYKMKMIAFNIDYIKQPAKENEVIYICEGIFDALSLEQAGVKAIATNSVEQYKNLFINKIKDNIQTASKYTYILSLDNDTAGIKTTNKIIKELADLKIQYKLLAIPKQYKDVNEWYIASDKGEFSMAIKQNITDIKIEEIEKKNEAETSTINYEQKTIANYITNSFLADIKEASQYNQRTTGFKELDKAIEGVYPGLYVLGAISSLGKTTFIHQIADQMAEAGEKVIYFSLEQSKFELVSKSIGREIYKKNLAVGSRSYKKTTDIMKEETPAKETTEAIKEYKKIANNIIIEEGNFNTSVETIRTYIEDYIKQTSIKPIVFIDYLQIIKTKDYRISDKQQIDVNVTELKRISRDFKIPVFVISSFNRDSYSMPVSYSSFKESGGIEYTADVVLGLQLAEIEEIKITPNNKVEVSEKLDRAKREIRRRLLLIGLKNRSGNPYFKIHYNYITPANYFEEVGEVDYN